MNTNQAFISGFVKRATEHGVAEADAVELLKTSAVGLGLDLAMLGAPSAIGAGIGGNYTPQSNKELEEEMAYTEDPSISKALKYLAVPGYAGFRHAKVNRLEHAYQKYQDDNRARQMLAQRLS